MNKRDERRERSLVNGWKQSREPRQPCPLPSPSQHGQEMEKAEGHLEDFLPCRAGLCRQLWCPTSPLGRVCAAFPHPPPRPLRLSSGMARQLLSPITQPVPMVMPHCDFVAKTYIFSSPALRRGKPSGPKPLACWAPSKCATKPAQYGLAGERSRQGERGIPQAGGSHFPGPRFQPSGEARSSPGPEPPRSRATRARARVV